MTLILTCTFNILYDVSIDGLKHRKPYTQFAVHTKIIIDREWPWPYPFKVGKGSQFTTYPAGGLHDNM